MLRNCTAGVAFGAGNGKVRMSYVKMLAIVVSGKPSHRCQKYSSFHNRMSFGLKALHTFYWKS